MLCRTSREGPGGRPGGAPARWWRWSRWASDRRGARASPASTSRRPDGIRVSAIAPGNTLTEMIRTWEADSPGLGERLQVRTPLRRAADPDEIAQAAARLLSDRSPFVTGIVLRVGGGARA